MEYKTATMRTGAKEKLSHASMQGGTMREEERGDEGGQQWGYSAGRLFLRRIHGGACRVSGVHAVLVYLTRSFPVPSQKHGL